MAARSDALSERIDGVEHKVDALSSAVERRFDEVDTHLEKVDRCFEDIGKRFEEVDRRFDEVDKRFDEVSANFVEQREYTEFAFERVQQVITVHSERIDRLERAVETNTGGLLRLEHKIDRLIDGQPMLARRRRPRRPKTS